MNRRLRYGGVVALLLVVSVIVLAGCSGSSNSTVQTPTAPPSGGTPPGGGTLPEGGTPPGAEKSVEGTSAYLQSGGTATKSNQDITVSNADESGVKVTNSGTLTLSDSTVTTTGNTSSMDNSSFYGLNAAVLAESGSTIYLANCTITTSGTGANGVFATGAGSSVTLTNVKINCTASGAHGVDTTIAGTLVLTDVDITTAGDGAAAAIATDRGGGTITVTGGIITTSGGRSPGIYSTGDITITGATITATGSEAAVIEGKNSISLTNTTLSGAKSWGVMIYQSMSGDASMGTGDFTMTGGSLTASEGPLFFCTNTKAVILLRGGAELNATSGILLKASAGDWGNTGSNGAEVTFTADGETLNGNISGDSISTIVVTLQNSTTLNGAINTDNTAKLMSLVLDKTSTWNVMGTSYLTSLTDADTTLANIKGNGNTIYYDSGSSANSWLSGKTYTLTDGGKLTPI
jgi:hypothetical protein